MLGRGWGRGIRGPLGCKGSKPQLHLASAAGGFGSRLPAKLTSGSVRFSVLQPHREELLLHRLGLVSVTASSKEFVLSKWSHFLEYSC